MGDQLRNLGEAQFTRATAVGAKPSFGDWKVAPELLSGSLAAAAAELAMELPTSQSTPPMFTNSDQTGAIAPLNVNSLEASFFIASCLCFQKFHLPCLEQDKISSYHTRFLNIPRMS